MNQGRLLVLQSGGPTAVINQSVAGVLTASRDYPEKITGVIGAAYGFHGLLTEQLMDLSSLPTSAWDHLGATPGAALGSARLKPKHKDVQRILEVLKAHNITTLLTIGGNDSAEAAQLIRAEANRTHFPVSLIHVPKTIDNDLCVTDHCPGYGSVARVVSNIIAGDELDNCSFRNGIKINVCMGRHAGWIAAATSLAKYRLFEGVHHRPDYGPHLIYTPENPFTESQFIKETQQVYDRLGRVTVVVAEGVADTLLAAHAQGEKDEYGNAQLSGSGKLGDYLGDLVENNIQRRPELGKLRVRADTWGYLQRSIPGLISPVDQAESFWVGAMAVRYAMQGETDKMVTLVRKNGDRYTCETGLCDLEEVAQKTKTVPKEFFNAQGNGMSEAFIRYAEPLAGVLPEVSVLNAPLIPPRLGLYAR